MRHHFEQLVPCQNAVSTFYIPMTIATDMQEVYSGAQVLWSTGASAIKMTPETQTLDYEYIKPSQGALWSILSFAVGCKLYTTNPSNIEVVH